MAELWLDFERPVIELEKKIEELKAIDGIGEELERLTVQLERLKKKVYSNLTRWQQVQLARHSQRPYTLDYIKLLTQDFIELHGDRNFGDDAAIVAGIGRIDGHSLVIVGHQKGRDTKEKLRRNFGMPHPEGYRKALRLMQLGERFKLPILTFVDTPGAYPGVGAEERGQSEAIARNLREMAVLGVPIIVVVTGEGGSGGALAIAVGNRVLMLENSIYSVISPEGCASILWRDSKKAPQAAEALRLTSKDLMDFGIIDEIIPEPLGGAHRNWPQAAENLKTAVVRNLTELETLTPDELVRQRVDKFNRMGVWSEEE
jgi:acetyl-CoA carboxylase carboxyl transferase subunit alpha